MTATPTKGTTTITQYVGASTLTVAGPSCLTLTIWPTTATTTQKTKTVIIPTTTETKTSTPHATSTVGSSAKWDSHCYPGDADVKERTGLVPTHDQSITLCERPPLAPSIVRPQADLAHSPMQT